MLQQTKGNPQFACCVSSRTTNTLVLLQVIGHPAQRVLVSVSTLLAMRCRPTRHTALEAVKENLAACISNGSCLLVGQLMFLHIPSTRTAYQACPTPRDPVSCTLVCILLQIRCPNSVHCYKDPAELAKSARVCDLLRTHLSFTTKTFIKTSTSQRILHVSRLPRRRHRDERRICHAPVGGHSPGARIARKHEIFRPHAKFSLNFSLCGKRQSENTVQRQMLCQGSFVVLSQRGAHFRVG